MWKDGSKGRYINQGEKRKDKIWPLLGLCFYSSRVLWEQCAVCTVATPHLIAVAKKVFLSLSSPLFTAQKTSRGVFLVAGCNHNYRAR